MPRLTRTPALLLGLALAAALPACGLAASAAPGPAAPASSTRQASAAAQAGAADHPSTSASSRPSASPRPAASSGARGKPLAGVTIGIDPGHNGRNGTDPGYINHRIWNGRAWEACDTTGTQTDAGYTEARFTFQVARLLRGDLRAAGARVVMTRTGNQGVGPCVDRRARIINRGRAKVAVDIHADGGPSWGRGFSLLEPVADGPNNKIIGASARLARVIRAAVRRHTPMPVSNYYGHDGLQPRDDLAGLNLATEPKILIESGNMRNGADARLLTSPAFQRKLAKALEDAIVAYLSHH